MRPRDLSTFGLQRCGVLALLIVSGHITTQVYHKLFPTFILAAPACIKNCSYLYANAEECHFVH
jgi:hypothetical protein